MSKPYYFMWCDTVTMEIVEMCLPYIRNSRNYSESKIKGYAISKMISCIAIAHDLSFSDAKTYIRKHVQYGFDCKIVTYNWDYDCEKRGCII